MERQCKDCKKEADWEIVNDTPVVEQYGIVLAWNQKIKYYSRCVDCKEKHRIASRKNRQRRKQEGKCMVCGSNKATAGTKCRDCWFKAIAQITTGDIGMAKIIEKLFEDQNAKSALSGEKLVIGKNASLDHIEPRVLAPERKADPNNLRWVTKSENSAMGGALGAERRFA